MTLRQFLDAGYTLLIEEYQRLGMSLMEALEKLEPMRAHVPRADVPVSEAVVVSENEASMRKLVQMMGGLG